MYNKLELCPKSPLYTSSILITVSFLFNAGFSFIFWLLVAKFYTKEDIGFATAIISSVTLLILFSRFGLDQSMIKYLPTRDKSDVFSTSIIIPTVISVFLGVIFLLGIDIWSPRLIMLKNFAPLFLIFLVANSILAATGTSLLALRSASSYCSQILLASSKVIFIQLFLSLGMLGIFLSFSTSIIIALIFSTIVLWNHNIKLKNMDLHYFRESLDFSLVTYIVGILLASPNFLLPLMVLNILGPDKTAHYYIVYSIASLLFMAADAFSISLFIEGSHYKNIKNITRRSFFIASIIIETIGISFIFWFGEPVLKLFGSTYIEGFPLLKLMAISSVFVAVSYINFSVEKIQKNNKGLLFHSALIFILIVGLSYSFLLKFGLLGIGYAWFLAYGINSILILANSTKNVISIK